MYTIHLLGRSRCFVLDLQFEVAKFTNRQNQSVSNAFMYICFPLPSRLIGTYGELTRANLVLFFRNSNYLCTYFVTTYSFLCFQKLLYLLNQKPLIPKVSMNFGIRLFFLLVTCFGFDTVFLQVGFGLIRKSAKVGLDLLRFSSDFGLDLNKNGFLNLKSMVY